jgi:hypothetical protein
MAWECNVAEKHPEDLYRAKLSDLTNWARTQTVMSRWM